MMPGPAGTRGSAGALVAAAQAMSKLSTRVGTWSGLAILVFIVTIIPDLIARALFRFSISGLDDLSVAVLVGVAFLGLAAAQAKREHFDVRALDHLLSARGLAVLRLVRLLVSFAVVVIVTGCCAAIAAHSWVAGERTMNIVPFPVWPARFMIVAGFTLLGMQLLADIYLAARALRGGR